MPSSYDLDQIAAEMGMPTPESAVEDLVRELGDEALQELRSKPRWTALVWGDLCLASYVGMSQVKACQAARVSRDTLRHWCLSVEGLRELYDSYQASAEMRLAGRVMQHAFHCEDAISARWAAERRCEQFAPPARQLEQTIRTPGGVQVVLEGVGAQVVEPPPAKGGEE